MNEVLGRFLADLIQDENTHNNLTEMIGQEVANMFDSESNRRVVAGTPGSLPVEHVRGKYYEADVIPVSVPPTSALPTRRAAASPVTPQLHTPKPAARVPAQRFTMSPVSSTKRPAIPGEASVVRNFTGTPPPSKPASKPAPLRQIVVKPLSRKTGASEGPPGQVRVALDAQSAPKRTPFRPMVVKMATRPTIIKETPLIEPHARWHVQPTVMTPEYRPRAVPQATRPAAQPEPQPVSVPTYEPPPQQHPTPAGLGLTTSRREAASPLLSTPSRTSSFMPSSAMTVSPHLVERTPRSPLPDDSIGLITGDMSTPSMDSGSGMSGMSGYLSPGQFRVDPSP